MRNEKFDAIVIGAGVGGSTAGAVLAQKEGMKILVLEKAARIGGRDISFDGSTEDPENYKRLIREAAHTWYIKSEPGLTELFTQGYLNEFTIEAGIHVDRHFPIQKTHLAITAPQIEKVFLLPSSKWGKPSIWKKVIGVINASTKG